MDMTPDAIAIMVSGFFIMATLNYKREYVRNNTIIYGGITNGRDYQ